VLSHVIGMGTTPLVVGVIHSGGGLCALSRPLAHMPLTCPSVCVGTTLGLLWLHLPVAGVDPAGLKVPVAPKEAFRQALQAWVRVREESFLQRRLAVSNRAVGFLVVCLWEV
jgi:hypothetical protein